MVLQLGPNRLQLSLLLGESDLKRLAWFYILSETTRRSRKGFERAKSKVSHRWKSSWKTAGLPVRRKTLRPLLIATTYWGNIHGWIPIIETLIFHSILKNVSYLCILARFETYARFGSKRSSGEEKLSFVCTTPQCSRWAPGVWIPGRSIHSP